MNEIYTESDNNLKQGKRGKRRLVIKIIIFLILTYILARVIFEKDMLQYKTYEIEHKDIPSNFDGFKIIQLTDIHFRSSSNTALLKKMVKKVNSEHADIIVLTGDYIDRGTNYIDDALELLGKLEANYGIYATLGNHDGWDRHDPLYEGLTNLGITVVENTYDFIEIDGQQIYLCGIEDIDSGYADFSQATKGAKEDDYVIMLSHNPNASTLINSPYRSSLNMNAQVDLMFSGHTHGGQITLFGLYAPILPGNIDQSLVTGHSKQGDTDVIVSNGIGTTIINVRFFARPQVVITTLLSPD